MGKRYAGTALCRSWMAYHHGHMLEKQAAYLEALGWDISVAREKERVATKGEKVPSYNLYRSGNWA